MGKRSELLSPEGLVLLLDVSGVHESARYLHTTFCLRAVAIVVRCYCVWWKNIEQLKERVRDPFGRSSCPIVLAGGN